MRILALTWPTTNNGQNLMINKRRDLLCPAIDGISDELLKLGHSVICVNAAREVYDYDEADLNCPGFISGLPFFQWKDIKNKNFDIIWHAIQDPTPEQAIEPINKIMKELDTDIPVLNPVSHIKTHTKRKYLTELTRSFGGSSRCVGVPIYDEYDGFLNEKKQIDYAKCLPANNGVYVSKDKTAIRLYNTNNHTGNLNTKGITLRYRDTSNKIKKGYRSFFRVPYAMGKCLPGKMYFCPEEMQCPKSGSAVFSEPFEIETTPAATIGAALTQIGVHIAHLEGILVGQVSVEIFDVNPFPSSYGKSLTPMSKEIAKRISQVYDL